MPQLDPTFFISQLFWLGVSFALLFVLMQFWALPGVTKVIEKRQKIIEGDRHQAEQLKAEIERLTKSTEQNLRAAKTEASAMIKKATTEMRHEHQLREKELSIKLQTHIKTAEDKMNVAKNEALKSVQEASLSLAEDMITRLTNASIKKETIQSEITQVIGNKHV